MSDLGSINFDALTPAEFEQHLPDLFLAGGKLSEDPRLTRFLSANPDCAALVRDLETIAETARSLFEPVHEPSDAVWSNIASKLAEEAGEDGGVTDLAG
ncbi:MAG TPA: hypothetical protein VKV02_13715 [Acidobacteriaceae bacterium]|nr:hypothetical protein [Acidobacteriaceae bacterium]